MFDYDIQLFSLMTQSKRAKIFEVGTSGKLPIRMPSCQGILESRIFFRISKLMALLIILAPV